MNRTAFKIAASTLIVSLTMASGPASSGAMRRYNGPSSVPADRDAARLHERAARALAQGQLAEAQDMMEQAVAAAPRDAGYRLLLADIYMRGGRFESARATYADVLELDPSNVRAGMSFALTQIAVGRPAGALAQLGDLEGRASGADVGLAYALAGQPQRAIEILEPLARSQTATARIRQNLALSYALAGDWRRARAIAAQDVAPVQLEARMTQWAAMARPDAGTARIAGLMGISPAADSGQPIQLALSQPAPAPVQMAEAAPAPVVLAEAADVPAAPADTVSDWGLPASAPAPVQVAEAPTYYTPAPAEPAEAPSEAEVQIALAAETLNRPTPAMVRTASLSLPPAPAFRRAAPRPVTAAVRAGNSRFVVQLGAFSNEGNAERAWLDAERRFGLRSHAPLTATFNHGGRTLHRVAVSGFASQNDAQRMCGSIRAQGGACFVRASAGDSSIRWAARYANGRTRNV